MAYQKQINIQSADSFSIDAFGRQRVSTDGNRFDVEFIYDKQNDYFDEVTVTGGTVTQQSGGRDLILAINNTTTATEASMYSYDIPYTAGYSQEIHMTGVLNLAALANGTVEFFKRSSVSGSVVDTAYVQGTWTNHGVSTTSLFADMDWTKSFIFKMDFQSLKVGRIRYYFVRNGIPIVAHEVFNDNIINTGYWQNPSLPIYWRIYNDSTYTYCEMGYGDTANGIGIRFKVAKNATATMRAICGTVKSEGGSPIYEMDGLLSTADMGTTTKTVATSIIPLISIRPRSTFNTYTNRCISIPVGFSVQTDNPIKLVLIYNGTLTGAAFSNVDTNNSVMEYDTTASAITGGHIFHSEYIATSKNINQSDRSLLGKTLLWNRRGTQTGIMTIGGIRTTSTSANVLISTNWKEIR